MSSNRNDMGFDGKYKHHHRFHDNFGCYDCIHDGFSCTRSLGCGMRKWNGNDYIKRF